jgi:hypothetical protein
LLTWVVALLQQMSALATRLDVRSGFLPSHANVCTRWHGVQRNPERSAATVVGLDAERCFESCPGIRRQMENSL